MKKIALYFGLIIASLSALDSEIPQNQEPSGWFFGIGLGSGVQTWKIKYLDQKMGNDHFLIPNLSAKLGAYHYLSNRFGIRYYYSLDLDHIEGNTALFQTNAINSYAANHPGFIMSSQTHMINLDLTFGVYAKENKHLDLIGGIGMGAFVPRYLARDGSQRLYSNGSFRERFVVHFQTWVNVGAKMMFNKKYGLELMGKIPVTPPATMNSYWQDSANNSQTKIQHIKITNYLITLGFVMEL